jgi:hypothetical protein
VATRYYECDHGRFCIDSLFTGHQFANLVDTIEPDCWDTTTMGFRVLGILDTSVGAHSSPGSIARSIAPRKCFVTSGTWPVFETSWRAIAKDVARLFEVSGLWVRNIGDRHHTKRQVQRIIRRIIQRLDARSDSWTLIAGDRDIHSLTFRGLLRARRSSWISATLSGVT